MNTSAVPVPGTGAIAHVSDNPVYTAPASHAFEVAPASRYVYVAPAGEGYVAPPGRTSPVETSSGIGINVDHGS
jgi:hypothetical protein